MKEDLARMFGDEWNKQYFCENKSVKMHTTTHKIISGDSRQMSELKDRSVKLTAYLYLENKTFLKARLTKMENSLDFKYKSNFVNSHSLTL
ncbi:MAG: hypothetical protein LBR10_09245 [Prevotellaceae bacterium]|nr:hypothetical protein [Prevotellaceae bacterium]